MILHVWHCHNRYSLYCILLYIYLKTLYKIPVTYYFFITIQYLVRHFDALLGYEWYLRDSINNCIILYKCEICINQVFYTRNFLRICFFHFTEVKTSFEQVSSTSFEILDRSKTNSITKMLLVISTILILLNLPMWDLFYMFPSCNCCYVFNLNFQTQTHGFPIVLFDVFTLVIFLLYSCNIQANSGVWRMYKYTHG